MTGVIRPIFIIGPGRSGTTLLLRLMSLHPDLAWFSGWTNRFPKYPQLACASRVNDIAYLEKITRRMRKWPRPGETYRIWNYCFPGFSNADTEWGKDQFSIDGAKRLERLVKLHLRWQGKKRFLTKYTGWPRIQLIRSIFPAAYFVYIDRDPRAVVYSIMKHKWWNKSIQSEPLDVRLEYYANRYQALYKAKQLYQRDEDYFQVYYEQLIESPSDILQDIFIKCVLPWNISIEKRIRSWAITKNTNLQWKQFLSTEEANTLTSLLEEPIVEMGYFTNI